ncbi:MAG: FHA domain-containing protein [Deltaproteobacteria bacterium]
MRVVLRVDSGPALGRRIALTAGQKVQVGRTEWAEFALPVDPSLSPVHFALQTDYSACYIEDLGSTGGTFLGEIPLTERTVLRDGDEIVAGATRFVVAIEDGLARETLSPVRAAPARRARRVDGIPSSEPPRRPCFHCSVRTCGTGLSRYRGSADEISPADVAGRLVRWQPLHFVIDFGRAGVPPPGEPASPEALFDWLAPAAAATLPAVMSAEGLPDWTALVEEGWGSDAVICLFSRLEKAALAEQLRRFLRAPARPDDPQAGILGLCWPSVLSAILEHYEADFVRSMLAGVPAVLVEPLDQPKAWQLFGGPELGDALARLGFQPRQEIAQHPGAAVDNRGG